MTRLTRGKGFDASILIWVLVFAVGGLWLFSQFTELKTCSELDIINKEHGCSVAGDTYRGFEVPSDVSGTAMTLMQILVIGIVLFGAYAAVTKLKGTAMTKRDAMALILLGIGLWWMWNNVLVNVLGSATLEELAAMFGKKTGLIP